MWITLLHVSLLYASFLSTKRLFTPHRSTIQSFMPRRTISHQGQNQVQLFDNFPRVISANVSLSFHSCTLIFAIYYSNNWIQLVRGRRKRSQKPSKTNKIIFQSPPPSPRNVHKFPHQVLTLRLWLKPKVCILASPPPLLPLPPPLPPPTMRICSFQYQASVKFREAPPISHPQTINRK